MENFFDLLSVLVLLTSFVLVSNKKITAYIKTFRIQSALIALTAGIMGWHIALDEGKYDILIICVIIVALKVVFIPHLLYKTYGNIEYRVVKDFFMNIPIIVLNCCGLVVFSYFSVSNIGTLTGFHINHQVVNSFSVVLIGFFFMISRKKAIG
jgi:hydrogenase-4 component E